MTFDEFMELVLGDFPNAEVGQDNDGQLVIYTNMTIAKVDIVVTMDE